MTLYLGSSEINPVETVEVIKEVPTEQDLTLMGNELRRAYCWSRQVNVNGMCCLYDAGSNKFSSYFNASTIYIGVNMYNQPNWSSPYTPTMVMDGKLYDISSSSASISLTQFGTDTNWNKAFQNGGKVSKNGYIYSSKNSLTTSLSQEYGDFKSCYGYDGDMYYINNGKIMDGSTVKHNGNWLMYRCYFPQYYGVGILNNKITAYSISSNSIGNSLSYTITDENKFAASGYATDTFYFAIDNTIYKYTHNYNTGVFTYKTSFTFDYKIKKLVSFDYEYNYPCFALLENNDLYRCENDSSFKSHNVKDVFCGNKNYIYLTTDNKLYSISYLNNSTPTLLHTFDYDVEVCNLNTKNKFIQCFKVVNDSPAITYYNQYTTQYVDEITKSYPSYDSDEDLYNITSKTASSITVNGNEYTRNGSGDAIFTFVPEDLENHTFTDTDLLQAYLDAGIRQQQSS